VPQNRKRVFIIGHLRGQSRPKVFPFRKVAKEVEIGVIGTTQNPEAEGTNSRHWVHDMEGAVGAVGASDYKQPKQIMQVGNIVDDSDINFKNPQRGRIYNPEGICPTLNTVSGGGLQPKIVVRACLTPSRINKRQNGRRFKNGDYKIRKLTPLEFFRLQGFPDEWYHKCRAAGISDTQMYRAAGDAVTVNVVQEIGRRLKTGGLNESKEKVGRGAENAKGS